MFSYYLREVVIPTLLSKILLYLPVDVAKLGEPRKFLCVSFLILSYLLPFILSGLHASILTVVSPCWGQDTSMKHLFEGRLGGPLFEGRIVGYTTKVPHWLEMGRIMGI